MPEAKDVKSIFVAALEQAESTRTAFVAAACAVDEALRVEVLDLLAAAAAAGQFLATPTSGGVVARRQPQSGDRIGHYRLQEKLGEGGFGTVWLAEQQAPVRRQVALKLLKAGMDSAHVLARFEAERQALALMDHPNIAKVFDGGATPDGQPFFVMELVRGVPVTEFCDTAQLTPRQRLELFVPICQAVQHAHHKGVIHRDIKPSNVLVALQDGRPIPKVIDFGIAKATGARLTERTLFTGFQQLLGTPEYMAPEQAERSELDVDTRADVYSLGVLLYELLTGSRPFDSKDLLAAGIGEMLRRIREDEPPKPSTRVTSLDAKQLLEVARVRQVAPHTLGKMIRGELDWVVMRALERDRNRRYETAAAFADDVVRFLVGDPVAAGPPSAWYRARRFARRHRIGFVAGIAATVSLGVGLLVAWRGWEEASIQATDANLARSAESQQRHIAETRATELAATAATLRRRTDEFDLLALVVQVDEATSAEATLCPPWPDQIQAMQAWLGTHGTPLVAAASRVDAAVAELRARTLSATDAARHADQHAADAADGFLLRTLADLSTRLKHFEQRTKLDVAERLRWAQQIDTLTRAHPLARTTWEAARAAIAAADGTTASTRYREVPVDLRPQMGLVPIGCNPVTRLWEFYDLRSSFDSALSGDPAALPIPTHTPDGSIAVETATGVVFVLVPGGTFWFGAQADDPAAPNFDRTASKLEGPPVPVTLAPFFLARHELTQGQWRCLSGGEMPSFHRKGKRHDPSLVEPADDLTDLMYPVERVSWEMATQLLLRHGMDLPTEAQWEYASRAGTATPWWTGETVESLEGAANVLDLEAERAVPQWGRAEGGFSDGHVGPAAVGSFRANPWGLHDTHGNLFEWCRDWASTNQHPLRAGDGLRLVSEPARFRIVRGGGYNSAASLARVARPEGFAPEIRNTFTGVRPARALQE